MIEFFLVDAFDRPPRRHEYSGDIAAPSRRRFLVHCASIVVVVMTIAAWRSRSGLAMIGDSGSYLAGAEGLARGRLLETPLVPSFSELSLIDTVRASGWSPYADFGVGLPAVIALVSIVMPLTTAAGVVNVISVGLIALAVMVGPWSPRHTSELWMRSALAVALSCWPILRFTAVGVLSEPLFCACLVWLAIAVPRLSPRRPTHLIGLGILTLLIGTVRFIGPVAAIVIAILLVQRDVHWKRAGVWAVLTGVVPAVITTVLTGGGGTRELSLHGLEASDVFFTARGIGGWFEAGYGDQTATLLRLDFTPTPLDWVITVGAAVCAIWVLSWWTTSIRHRTSSPLQPALVLAILLALGVLPSMLFLDAVLKLDNRILMPSGLLVICALGWFLAERAPQPLAWGLLVLWTIVATHPWQVLARPDPPASTDLTDVVEGLDADFVITNNADLVWWITGVPARYLPDGYHDLSARSFDSRSIIAALPCALAETGGIIVAETSAILPAVLDQLTVDTSAGKYTRAEDRGIAIYTPTTC